MIKRLEVVEIESGMTVREIETAGKGEREIEKITMGLLRQMDTDRFFVREVEEIK